MYFADLDLFSLTSIIKLPSALMDTKSSPWMRLEICLTKGNCVDVIDLF